GSGPEQDARWWLRQPVIELRFPGLRCWRRQPETCDDSFHPPAVVYHSPQGPPRNCGVGQPIMAAAAFRGGSALERRNRSDCCKAETQTSCGAGHFRDDGETAKAGI